MNNMFLCKFCGKSLKEPVQINSCYHVFCLKCIIRWEKHLTENRSLHLKKTQTYPCPLCKMPYSFHKLMPIPVLDKAIRELETRPQDKNNLIKRIHLLPYNLQSIRCPNLKCPLIMPKCLIAHHAAQCPYQEKLCPNCHLVFYEAEFKIHSLNCQ